VTPPPADSVDTQPDDVRPGAPDGAVPAGAALLAAVRAIGSATDAYRRAVATEAGLGTADLVALSLLHRDQPQQPVRISDWTGLTPGSVTALLDRLETRGYVTRARPAHDRRILEVNLTPAGRALGDAVINALLPTMDRIADELGPSACEIALTAFGKINAALDELAADPRLGLPDPPPRGSDRA
jgi:DNA-binding MarR family transcriptional regulator